MTVDQPWTAPPPAIDLSDDEIHVWRAVLDRPREELTLLAETLSVDERGRAERFFFEHDRRHFIAGRGILRQILARYTAIAAHRIAFCYGPRGKPALFEASGSAGLSFNVSHSDGVALYAVTRRGELGIDVESMRPLAGIGEIAARFFSPAENEALLALPPGRMLDGFYTCWTRKEAFIKATGHGLSMPLDRFDVSLDPGTSRGLLKIDGAPQAASRWLLRSLPVGPGFRAALAVEGHSWAFRFWCFS